MHCAACGKTTHQNAYTQYFYNTQARGGGGGGSAAWGAQLGRTCCLGFSGRPRSYLPLHLTLQLHPTLTTPPPSTLRPPPQLPQATTLQMAQLVAEGAASMGALLRDAEAQHRKSCDTDMSGCGVLNSVNHFLQAAPRVFTLQVGRVWCGVVWWKRGRGVVHGRCSCGGVPRWALPGPKVASGSCELPPDHFNPTHFPPPALARWPGRRTPPRPMWWPARWRRWTKR